MKKLLNNLTNKKQTIGQNARVNTSGKKDIYNTIYHQYPTLFDTTQELLRKFVRRERKIIKIRSPREHFAMEQLCRTTYEFFSRMKRSRLGYLDIRENIENLYCLFEYLIEDSPKAAQFLARLLGKIICTIAEMATRIEEGSGVKPTNWELVLTQLMDQEKSLDAKDVPLIIPQMRMIKTTSLLGAGGFGSVYKALFADRLPCTVKLVRYSMFDDDKNACVDKVVGSMTYHPLLVNYYSCFGTRDSFVTIMEYVRGVDLDKVVNAGRGFPMKVLRPVCAQLGIAVSYLHFKGCLHRDIKPSNIMIMPGCRIKLIDFDTVKICIGMFSKRKLKSFFKRTSGEFCDTEAAGTLSYFPPEFFEEGPYGRASDWWSVGATIYEICFGKCAFRGASDSTVEKKIVNGRLRFPNEGPPSENLVEFKDLVVRLLRKKASERMCSRRYSEFLCHPFFRGMDLVALEKGNISIKYKVILKLMKKKKDGNYTVLSTSSLDRDSSELIKADQQKDLTEHHSLFTFVSAYFRSIVSQATRNEPITLGDPAEKAEIIITRPPTDANQRKYKFEKFLKN